MLNTFYNLTNDHLIKGVLKSQTNLRLLLKDLFNIEGKNISIKNTEILNENKKGKYGLIDILFILDETYYILEVQNKQRHDFENRLLYYTSSIIKQYSLETKENYNKIKSVKTLAIINYEDGNYNGNNEGKIILDNGKLLTDKSLYKIINLRKTKNKCPITEMFKCKDLKQIEKYKNGIYKDIYELIRRYNQVKRRGKKWKILHEKWLMIYTLVMRHMNVA